MSSRPAGRGGVSLGVVVVLAGVVLVAALVFTVLGAGRPTAPPAPIDRTGASSPTRSGPPASGPIASAASTADPGATPGPSGAVPSVTPDPAATPSPPPPPVDVAMPIVPVVGFWEPGGGLSRDELVAALEGRSDRFADVWLPVADRDAIAGALGIGIAESVRSAAPDEILRAVREGGLGLLRAADLEPRVRALPLDLSELIGTERVDRNAAWPLTIPVTVAPEEAWDQASVITLVAGGDMLMDRGIYERVYNRHKGIDYPFDGGTVRITGRYCCGPFPPFAPEVVPSFVKTGNKGIVRAMLQDADLAFGNLENPITDDWVFRVYGTPFSGRPELTRMFVNAGIDWVSLANNHMLDFGTSGIRDTYRYLRKYGIGFSGAGIDLEQARTWSVQQVGDWTVAILPCVAVAPGSWATDDSAGALLP